jgi:hypothetical protein
MILTMRDGMRSDGMMDVFHPSMSEMLIIAGKESKSILLNMA